MKKSTSLIAALLFAGATVASTAAMAADISHAPEALTLLDGTSDFGSSFSAGNNKNTFLDEFTFSFNGTSDFDGLVSSMSSNAHNGLDITSVALYGMNGLVSSFQQLETGKTDRWTLTKTGLAAGAYSVKVGGSAVSGKAGSFAGNLNVSAVPEPTTYGMMLGGLGLLGFMARRRKNAAA
ncbi:hypothetical protein ACFDR9_005660 [Janthinobacterium sp. CG_23.3]|uniref:FxDxF family PEP-CTERM protein n=1 Tax=unclassified Janthinobacterium TaxID=2610881 RepID=UPI00034AF996|nr:MULTISPECIES: FxDxF family PEP-CTERM protein [unclassified Janthinobacterium]MEC5159257.1 hypothetical protein [Janthinobacterium sp. CG_S6]